jgi:hypothetical protein
MTEIGTKKEFALLGVYQPWSLVQCTTSSVHIPCQYTPDRAHATRVGLMVQVLGHPIEYTFHQSTRPERTHNSQRCVVREKRRSLPEPAAEVRNGDSTTLTLSLVVELAIDR